MIIKVDFYKETVGNRMKKRKYPTANRATPVPQSSILNASTFV